MTEPTKRQADQVDLVEPDSKRKILRISYPAQWNVIQLPSDLKQMTAINVLMQQLSILQNPRLFVTITVTVESNQLVLNIWAVSATWVNSAAMQLLSHCNHWTWDDISTLMSLIDDPAKRAAQLTKIEKELRGRLQLWQQINAGEQQFWEAVRTLHKEPDLVRLTQGPSATPQASTKQILQSLGTARPLGDYVGIVKLSTHQFQQINWETYRGWLAAATNLVQSLVPHFCVLTPNPTSPSQGVLVMPSKAPPPPNTPAKAVPKQ